MNLRRLARFIPHDAAQLCTCPRSLSFVAFERYDGSDGELIAVIEVRFHGRGGQGAVVASEVLATALCKEGKFVQAFPAFGVERRGAPIMAFLRSDTQPIRRRCQIYSPDAVVVLDPTLVTVVDVSAGLKPNGLILINTERAPEAFGQWRDFRVATVAASAIAAAHQLGTRTNPIVNTALLGAFVRVTELVHLESVLAAVTEKIPTRPERNHAAARDAYEQVQIAETLPRRGLG